jgi:hypothetical protein
LLPSLPVGERSRSLTALPFLEGPILVVETEVSAGKPPLDSTAECSASTPAISIAIAAAVARVVDALEKASRDVASLLSERRRNGE